MGGLRGSLGKFRGRSGAPSIAVILGDKSCTTAGLRIRRRMMARRMRPVVTAPDKSFICYGTRHRTLAKGVQ